MEKTKFKLGTIYILLQSEKIRNLGKATMKSMKSKMDIAKNMKALIAINTETQETIDNLIGEYGSDDGNGGIVIQQEIDGKPNPKLKEFMLKREELFNVEEEVEIRKIKLEEFTNPDELDVNDLMLLEDIMIVD